MNKEIKVVNCWEGCPFANTSASARRIYVSCNLQSNVGSQWRSEGKNHKCFETCPLKKGSRTVTMEKE